MKPFALRDDMLATLGGAFYPTGYSVLMFEDKGRAQEAAQALVDQDAAQQDEIEYISPQALLAQITPTVADADEPLPSPGTDAATVRAFTALAREGHCALLVPTPDDEARDAVMAAVGPMRPTMAQRYRALVIEDL